MHVVFDVVRVCVCEIGCNTFVWVFYCCVLGGGVGVRCCLGLFLGVVMFVGAWFLIFLFGGGGGADFLLSGGCSGR